MEIQVIAPGFYPDEYYTRYFRTTAKYYGLNPLIYGHGLPFKNWIDTHIDKCLEVVKSLSCSHVLFTDASDVFVMRGMKDIEDAYKSYDCPPILVAREKTGINGGGWVGERYAMIDALELLKDATDSGDPQVRWRFTVGMEWLVVKMDSDSRIFKVITDDNVELDHRPCFAHLAGGYSDPINGKMDRMEHFMTGGLVKC